MPAKSTPPLWRRQHDSKQSYDRGETPDDELRPLRREIADPKRGRDRLLARTTNRKHGLAVAPDLIEQNVKGASSDVSSARRLGCGRRLDMDETL